jgi:diguanylate cyclase (GGDEF)-like protein/PAS domain S-box-containing protein
MSCAGAGEVRSEISAGGSTDARRFSILLHRSSKVFHRLLQFISIQGLCTLLLGLLATSVLFIRISALESNKLKLEFERHAEQRIAAVERGMHEAEDVLIIVNQLFSTMGTFSREHFQSFARALLKRHPHIRALSYQRIVSARDRANFEANMRKQYPGFTITELVDGKLLPAPARDRYRVLDYVEPMQGNEAAFGLNVAARKEQAGAAQRACETGTASATGLYRLVQNAGNSRLGFVLLMPVYRSGLMPVDVTERCEAVIGYTTAVLHSAEFIKNTHAMQHMHDAAEFDISVYADSAPTEEKLALRIAASDGAHARPAGFMTWVDRQPYSVSETFDVSGQPWHIVISDSSPPLLRNYLGSFLILIAGVLGSILAAAYVHMLVSRSRSVHQLVGERTRALRESNQSLRLREQAIEACVNSILIVSAQEPDYPIEYVNPAFQKMTGYPASEVIGRSCSLLWKNDADQDGVREIIAMIRQKRPVQATLRTYRKGGELFWSEAYIAPVENESGEIAHFVVAHYDITAAKRHEAELKYQANHDALTGLANRNLLQVRLGEAIEAASRRKSSVWVVFINIDRFKFINDSLGHRAGDEFLKEISRRLQAASGDSDTVARVGGDEFMLIFTDQAGRRLSADLVQDILNSVIAPVSMDGSHLFPSCSAGVAIYPADGEDMDTLLAHASLALRHAKELGRNNCQFYTSQLDERARERLTIETALRVAYERSEFMLHYQPQVDLCTGQVVGVEALLRWEHPQLGVMLPAQFIEIAEDASLIVPIGAWILRTACAQAKIWRDAGRGELRVAVNLSARQFSQPGIVEMVETVLKETGLPGSLLEIELTERLVMEDVEHAITVLTSLRELGVQLSIDDFGTGYSSLSYLKRFPIDVLKIDQSFVQEISPHSNDAAISDAIISMAHSLGMRVIAEGVETEAQCEFLSRNMCDEIQGFLFSKALPAEEIDALLREGRCLPEHLRRLQKRPRTLLLVDDEPNILAALKRLMRPAGYQILTAGSGQEGLEILSRHEADVIVSDQRMPGMTGVEFLRAVKTLYPETVRIVLSGFTELQSVTDAVNEGAIYKFLTKPWDDAQLREHVEKAFQHKQMLDENRRLDLEVRTANLELAKANRQLEEVLKQKQQKMQRNEITLDIVREALHHVPLPILGLDEDDVVAFANLAAQELFKDAGMILGSEAAQLMPEILHALRDAGDGEKRFAAFGGMRMEVVSRSMGNGTQSRGRLVTFSPGGAA